VLGGFHHLPRRTFARGILSGRYVTLPERRAGRSIAIAEINIEHIADRSEFFNARQRLGVLIEWMKTNKLSHYMVVGAELINCPAVASQQFVVVGACRNNYRSVVGRIRQVDWTICELPCN